MARLIAARLLVAFVLASTGVAHADLEGRVVGVADGDTLTILDSTNLQHKIRLAGIDAPEKGQPFGQRSKQSLSDLVFGKQVTAEGQKLDRYGRLVAKVLHDGHDANLEQVRRGLAWHYKAYEREQSVEDRRVYAAEEEAARGVKTGLWGMEPTVPPWAFRRAALRPRLAETQLP